MEGYIVFGLVLLVAGAFLFWHPRTDDEGVRDEDDYDAVLSVVYGRLDAEVSILAGDAELDRSMSRLNDIEMWARNQPYGSARKAYLYWLPHFKDKIWRYKARNDRWRRVDALRNKVPRP